MSCFLSICQVVMKDAVEEGWVMIAYQLSCTERVEKSGHIFGGKHQTS